MAINYGAYRARARRLGATQGVFKKLNDTAQQVQERIKELENNKARRALELAKTQHAEALKSAKAEDAEVDKLRQAGMLETKEDGSLVYTRNYWEQQAEADYLKKHGTEASQWANNEDLRNQYILNYMQGKPQDYRRRTKSSDDINQIMGKAVGDIGTQQSRNSVLSFTEGLAALTLGRMPERTSGTATPDFSHTMEDPRRFEQGRISPVAPTEAPKVTPFQDAVEEETGEPISNVFLVEDAKGGTKYVQRLKDGSERDVNVRKRSTTEAAEMARQSKTKIQKVDTDNLERYDRNSRVSSLAYDLATVDYTGNIFSWTASQLSLLGDAVGANFGMTGDVEKDATAILEYIESGLNNDEDAVKALGLFDAQAVQRGQTEAMQQMLSYALASLYTQDGRITVSSYESAKQTAEAWIPGSTGHRSKLLSVVNLTGNEMKRSAGQQLARIKDKPEDPLWSRFPVVEDKVASGLKYVSDRTSGTELAKKVDALKTSNPQAYQASIKALQKASGSTNTDTIILRPMVYRPKEAPNEPNPLMLFYKQDPQTGAYSFGYFPIK